MLYLLEHEYNIIDDTNPINFSQALYNLNFVEWINIMKDEATSMHKNEAWDLVKLLIDCKPIS